MKWSCAGKAHTDAPGYQGIVKYALVLPIGGQSACSDEIL